MPHSVRIPGGDVGTPSGPSGPGGSAPCRPDPPLGRVIELRMAPTRPPHPRGSLLKEAGMATAEYAIATLAAVGFAALLVAVLSSGEVRGLLMSLIQSALSFG